MKRFPLRIAVLLCLVCGTAAAAPVPITEAGGRELRPAEAPQTLPALAERLARLEAQFQSQGLLALLNEIEQLKAELARVKGVQEELGHQLAVADKRQKDLYADLDGRLKTLKDDLGKTAAAASAAAAMATAPAAQPPSGLPVAADAAPSENEIKAYQDAFGAIRANNYKVAIGDFQTFLKTYPGSSLAGNAQYWIGFSHFSLGDHKAAAESHQKLMQVYPTSPKVPDAMLGLARAQIQLGETKAAQSTLQLIVSQHAGTKVAESAQKLLATLK